MDMKISNMLLKMVSDIQKTEDINSQPLQEFSKGQEIEVSIIAKEGDTDKTNQLIRKFGVTGKKEIMQTKQEAARIPCDENSAVKYLLDSHLLLALLIPKHIDSNSYQKLEIYEYKARSGNSKTSEVHFKLELDALGRIEMLLRYINSSIYTRIWAESADTQRLLEDNKKALLSICSNTQIMAPSEGPLFLSDILENIDVRI